MCVLLRGELRVAVHWLYTKLARCRMVQPLLHTSFAVPNVVVKDGARDSHRLISFFKVVPVFGEPKETNRPLHSERKGERGIAREVAFTKRKNKSHVAEVREKRGTKRSSSAKAYRCTAVQMCVRVCAGVQLPFTKGRPPHEAGVVRASARYNYVGAEAGTSPGGAGTTSF